MPILGAMDRRTDKSGGGPVNPWDREVGLSGDSRRRPAGPTQAAGPSQPADPTRAAWSGPGAEIDARTVTPQYGEVPCVRKEPPQAVLFSPWAGVAGMACGIFCAAGPWLFRETDISTAVLVTGILAIVLGIYAAVGAYLGMGRPDIAASGIILGAAGLLLTFVWTPGTLLLTPT